MFCVGGVSRAGKSSRSSKLPFKEGPPQTKRPPLTKDRRLRKTSDFKAVQREGRSWDNRLVVMRVRVNGTCKTRIGFSVSRRLGKAVVRNLVKRRLSRSSAISAASGGLGCCSHSPRRCGTGNVCRAAESRLGRFRQGSRQVATRVAS